MSHFNILYLSSELYPFAKVGGLADVAGSLPKALKEMEHDIRVFLPKYKIIRDRKYNLREVIRLRDIEVPLGPETIIVSVKSGFIPDSKVQAYFLEYKPFFDRNGIYFDPKTGKGWKDDALRFALFARSALETLKVLYWQPDIIHVNDWPGALVPFYLKYLCNDDDFFENIRTVLTIHNLAYQGEFDGDVANKISADVIPFDKEHPAWHKGRFNFLKAGLKTADMITTVSPCYAREILSKPELSDGLHEVINERRSNIIGMLNGIDVNVWNPETDEHIAAKYSVGNIGPKMENRLALCREMGIDCKPERMIIGMVSRLEEQKGFDLLYAAADKLMKLPVCFAILGTGEAEIESKLEDLAALYPGRFVTRFAQDEKLAHLIEAGADVFLMPSKYEPCGMNQMYSLRYGTVPIVRSVGGLTDTVFDYKPNSRKSNGFTFEKHTQTALVDAIKRALQVFKDRSAWEKLMTRGMQQDYGWGKSTKKLLKIYGDTAVEPAS